MTSDVLLVIGIGVFGGLLGASLLQKLRFPQVVGYILIGLLLGQSGLQVMSANVVETLRPFSLFALGIIGFLVGGELRWETFRKYARQFTLILLGEGLASFVLVAGSCGIILYLVIRDLAAAIAAGVVFGAIASATDPASTISVLWETRSRGVLTRCITAIVALDDVLAMTLYGLGTGLAQLLTGHCGTIGLELGKVAWELGGAVLLGGAFAWLLWFFLRWWHQPDRTLGLALAVILLLIGIATATGLDVILASMTLGFCLVNFAPHRSKDVFRLLRGISTPIYIMFFVLASARLALGSMPGWLWGIVAVYVLARSLGKMTGAWVAARTSGAEVAVQRYLGMSLFAQGGVAVGLSIMASHHLQKIEVTGGMSLGDVIIFVVTATTLIVQLLGPMMVKVAVRLADEAGRHVTEDDVIAEWQVQQVMLSNAPMIDEATPIREAMRCIAEDDAMSYPVVNHAKDLVGQLSLLNLKAILADQDTWNWMLVADVMDPVPATTAANASLGDTLANMEQMHLEEMVVLKPESSQVAGMLDRRHALKLVSHEVVNRQHPAS